MNLYKLLVVGLVVFIIGCGSSIPSGRPDKSGDEALVKSAFEYEIKLVQKFFLPRLEANAGDYKDYLTKLKDIYGGSSKIDYANSIERLEKLQMAIGEYKKSWRDAESEIVSRSEAKESKVKDYLNQKLSEIYNSVKKDFAQEIKDLGKKEDAKDAEKILMKKIAEIFVPKANDMLKDLGFKDAKLKSEDITSKYYSPSLPEMKEIPYEVLQHFRNIELHVKYPVLQYDNNKKEYKTEFRTEGTTTYLAIESDGKWYLNDFIINQSLGNSFADNLISNAMIFKSYDWDDNISTPEEAAVTAANFYFFSRIVNMSYDVELSEEILDINNELGNWIYMFNPDMNKDDIERFEFIKDNFDKMIKCEIEKRHTELKKINADFDLSIKYWAVVETENDTKAKAEGEAKDEKKKESAIVSENGKYKLEEKTTYVRVYLNNIEDKWRIVSVDKINEPRKAEAKAE